MAIIQWFPGHMAKALRQVKENLKLVDVVLELVDARLPESSRNPQLKDLLQDKPSIIVLTKMDLADPKETRKWIEYYEKMGQPAVAINSVQGSLKVIDKKIKEVLAEKLANKKARGILSQRIKVMCIGIPNVGKSTLLNHLVKKNVAQVGNRPGVTKSQQWLKAGKDLQLLDTPGILWPKFEDQTVGQHLAFTGAIRDELIQSTELALDLIEFLTENYPGTLNQHYHVEERQPSVDTLRQLAEVRGCIGRGSEPDFDKAASLLLDDFRNARLGRITVERP